MEIKRKGSFFVVLGNILKDISLYELLIANAIVLYFAVLEKWALSDLIWIYFFQSLIIGVFQFLRIITLKNFSTKDEMINGEYMPADSRSKIFIGFFFLTHYGIFHMVYFLFLSNLNFNFQSVIFSSIIFFLSHSFSFLLNFRKDQNQKENIGQLMRRPYVRIIPMHLVIIMSGSFSLFIFLLAKTGADILGHILNHPRNYIPNYDQVYIQNDRNTEIKKINPFHFVGLAFILVVFSIIFYVVYQFNLAIKNPNNYFPPSSSSDAVNFRR